MIRVGFIFLFFIMSHCATAQNEYYVLFDSDLAEVPDTAMADLIKIIYSQEIDAIYLEGHCDSIGSKNYNYRLSERRVKAVEQLLVDNGFERNKIEGKVGFGKDKPRANNTTEDTRQMNRRVLVKFSLGEKEPELTNKRRLTSAADDKAKPKIPLAANSPLPLAIENFKPNAVIALPNLFFQGGRHFLLHESSASLDSLVRILKAKPDIKIEIQGHVCCTTYHLDGYDWDTKTHNLSVTRAHAIKRYLIRQGIAPERIGTRGFGGSRKLFPKEENRLQIKMNRRVEVMVLP